MSKSQSLSHHSRFVMAPPHPSNNRVHAVSRELALADGVAGASGRAGAHVTVNALGAPWAFFPYQTQDPISTSSGRRQAQEAFTRKKQKQKTGALTFHNRRARVVLGVSPDRFVVIFTQHIVVAILAFRPKFAICEIEQRAGGWSV